MPKMLNPTAWNWRGKTCFLWAGTCSICFVWCWFRLPEPKGLTYLELDLLFEKRVPARSFRRVRNVLSDSGYFDILSEGRGKALKDFRGVPSYG
jgi:SP family general alpha glucoside:H+ symporter-like MFS transporter